MAWGQLWVQGDWVTRLVGLLLLAMSIVTWSVLILKVIQMRRLRQQAGRALNWAPMDSGELEAWISQADSTDPYAHLADLARLASHELRQAQQTAGARIAIDPSDWMTRRLQNGLDQHWGLLQSRLTLLASVGATAPFVGLFGTVWGIYHALMRMGQSGQASIDQVAGPVGEALIMTAVGLAVAIPAVLAYNGLTRVGKNRQAHLREFAAELHARALMRLVQTAPESKV